MTKGSRCQWLYEPVAVVVVEDMVTDRVKQKSTHVCNGWSELEISVNLHDFNSSSATGRKILDTKYY